VSCAKNGLTDRDAVCDAVDATREGALFGVPAMPGLLKSTVKHRILGT